MQKRYGKIVKADHTGDTAIAEFEPGVENDQIKVAQSALTKFLMDCVEKHGGGVPPVFARRIGETTYTPFNPEFLPPQLKKNPKGMDRLLEVETVLIQQPLCGG